MASKNMLSNNGGASFRNRFLDQINKEISSSKEGNKIKIKEKLIDQRVGAQILNQQIIA